MLPALLVLAAAAGVNYLNNQEAQKRRESIRRSMENYQRLKAREVEGATESLLQKQTPRAREAELAGVIADRTQSLKDTVGAAQAFDAPATAGKHSEDYRALNERNAGTIAERTRRAIEQLATMGAPGEARQKFATRFGRAAGTVQGANNASANVGGSYQSDIAGVTPDPFIGMLSQIGMGAGQGMLAAPAGAEVNNGQGFEDASGNLYDGSVVSRSKWANAFNKLRTPSGVLG